MPDADPLPLYRALLDLFPSNVAARLHSGRILVERKDAQVIDVLEPLKDHSEPRVRMLAATFLESYYQSVQDTPASEHAKMLREQAQTPFGGGPQFIIRDNDDKFGTEFDRVWCQNWTWPNRK